MLQGFYSAVTGARDQMEKMGIHGNNIANVNTYGYKTEAPSFGILMTHALEAVEGNEIPVGSGSRLATSNTDYSMGDITETGRAQDYAILGEGFFALYDPALGEVSYTRDGSFTLSSYQEVVGQDEEGNPLTEEVFYLSDGFGRQVLDTGGYPIRVENPTEKQDVGVFTITYQDGLSQVSGGRFMTTEKNGNVYAGTAEVRQGMLESSNADLTTEMAKIIETQRAYSYALKMVTTADEVTETINGLTT